MTTRRKPEAELSIHRLAARIVGLERQVRGLSLPSLSYSAIDGGQIVVKDPDGNEIGQIGEMPDGSGGINPVNGPKPPKPSAPSVIAMAGGLTVRWDGGWADPAAITPFNFARVEVHLGETADFYTGSPLTLFGTIESARGGEVLIAPLALVAKYVVLVAWSTSGIPSEPSEVVTQMPGSVLTAEDRAFIDAELAANEAAIAANETALAENDAKLAQAQIDLDAAEAAIIDNDAKIATLQTDLTANDTKLAQAQTELDAAEVDLANAQARITELENKTASGSGRAYYQPTAPASGTDGDIWFDTDNGNRPHRWDPTLATPAWVDATFGAPALVAGSITSASGVIGQLDAGAITTGSLNANLITSGSMHTDRLTGKTITADRIATNGITAASGVIQDINASVITTGSMNASLITAGSMHTDRLTGKTINADRIATNTITATNGIVYSLNASTITTGVINANLITSGSMHTDRLTGKTITADRIFGNTITSASGVIANLSADHITSGAIAADRLTANSLTGRTITGGTIQTGTSGNRIWLSGSVQSEQRWIDTSGRYGRVTISGSGTNHTLRIGGPWDSLGSEWIELNTSGNITLGGYDQYEGNGGVMMTLNPGGTNVVTVHGEIIARHAGTGYTAKMRHSGSSGHTHIDSSYQRVYLNWFSGTQTAIGNGAQGFGTIYAAAFTLASSGVHKEKVAPTPAGRGLGVIRQLRPVSFMRTDRNMDDPTDANKTYHGLIAEEVEPIFPDAVARNADGEVEGIDYAAVITMLIQAVQDLDARTPQPAAK